MVVYILVVALCYIMTIVKRNEIKFGALVFIFIFLCFGYMTGTDWKNYELMYYSSDFSNYYLLREEVGYTFVQTLFNYIGLDFWIFHIATKILLLFILVRFVQIVGFSIFLFLAIFLPEVGFYLFIDCPFRNLIAMCLVLMGLVCLVEKDKRGFFFFSFFAIMFHLTAVMVVLFYFVKKVKISNVVAVALFVVANLLAYNLPLLIQLILPVLKFSTVAADRLLVYLYKEEFISSVVNIGTVHKIILFCFVMKFRKNIEEYPQWGRLIFNLTMLFFFLYPFGISIKILNRFVFYTYPFLIISLLIIINSIVHGKSKLLFIVFVVFYSLLKTYSLVTSDYRYVPYTNYLVYSLKGDHPEYLIRQSYNITNSPY